MERNARGIAALTTMVGLALLVAVVGTGMGLISFFETSISLSQAKSQEAYLMAQSGVQDAMLQLARNKDCYLSMCATISLSLGNNTATTTVADIGSGRRRVTGTGSAARRKRRIQADVAVDQTTGAITLISWKEISL